MNLKNLCERMLLTLELCALLGAGAAATGCRKAQSLLNAREKTGKGDLSAFVFRSIAKYGGTNVPGGPSAVDTIVGWVYSEDADGVQVACPGNKVEAICSIFRDRLGPPSMVKTNMSGLSAFVYGLPQAGLIINCGLERTSVAGTNQEVTHLVITHPLNN
jgi:hypothetical protein